MRVKIRRSPCGDGTCVISMRSPAQRCKVLSLMCFNQARITAAREPQGAIFGAPAMVSPNTTARSRPALPLASSREESWTEAAPDMEVIAGSQQRIVSLCGKVPYRLSSGFRPVKRFPFSCLPDTIDQPTRRYNHKGFERSLAGIEACQRKRKKEGCYLKLESAWTGGAGLTSTAGKLLRSKCQ
jgi:hypothetical protein